MKLTFLGTRGYIQTRSPRHARQSSLLVEYGEGTVMLDCGEDWLGKAGELHPGAIVITHAHPDHAWGLRDGAPCPVYATGEAWESLKDFALQDRGIIVLGQPIEIQGMTFQAFPVAHSTRAPTVGYRITAGEFIIFYAPDVVYIEDRGLALAGVRLYIGDGAAITRSLVRRAGESLVGHAPIRTQLTWCQKEGVTRAIFTHLGAEVVEGDEETVRALVRELGRERGMEAEVAHDGLEVVLS